MSVRLTHDNARFANAPVLNRVAIRLRVEVVDFLMDDWRSATKSAACPARVRAAGGL
jgi:hypothetical protein